MKTLTIVVPSYNTEKYIDECLPTLLPEEVEDDLEVLIVNDGSKDKTQEKAEGYAKQYPKMVRVINKENGGHGSTLNAGIREARGKYYRVIDGDDWAETDNLVQLVKFLKTCDSDLVLSPYLLKDEGTKKVELFKMPGYEKLNQLERTYDEVLEIVGQIPHMHSQTIKTEILRENDITITEHSFYVDNELIVFPIEYLNTVSYFDLPITIYRINSGTQSVAGDSLRKNFKQHEKVLTNIIHVYELGSFSPEKNRVILSKIRYEMLKYYSILASFESKAQYLQERKKFEEKLGKNKIKKYLKADSIQGKLVNFVYQQSEILRILKKNALK